MNPDLSVTYLGMKLRTPFVPSASPRSEHIENVEKMAEAGASAIVFHSLYSEQWDADPETDNSKSFRISPELYCEHIREAKKRVSIPIIGNLNVMGRGEWIEAAKRIEDAGADAIELNLQRFPSVTYETSDQIERETVEPVYLLSQTVDIPVAVKLIPYYTNLFRLASQLQDAGADGLTLFNRFVQPEIGFGKSTQFAELPLSTTMDSRLPMHWIAVMSPRLQLSLAASGGIEQMADAVRMLLVGANVAMLCSVLLRRGHSYIADLEQSLTAWMRDFGYTSIDQFRGTKAFSPWSDPAAEERNSYIQSLTASEHRLNAQSTRT